MSSRRSAAVLLGLVFAGAAARGAAPPLTRAFVQAELQRAQRLNQRAFRHAVAGRFAEAARLAETLAALRGRPLAGLAEVSDAAKSVMLHVTK